MAVTQDELYATLDLELSWSEAELRERERTKHVHRLHPYHGKFIPQLVEVLLERYFARGDHVLDPFAGSGTTLVQALESGLDATGVDIAAFNCLLMRVKTASYDLPELGDELRDAYGRIESLGLRRRRVSGYLREWYAPGAAAELLDFGRAHPGVPARRRPAGDPLARGQVGAAGRPLRSRGAQDPTAGGVLVLQAPPELPAGRVGPRFPQPLHARHAGTDRGVREGSRHRARGDGAARGLRES